MNTMVPIQIIFFSILNFLILYLLTKNGRLRKDLIIVLVILLILILGFKILSLVDDPIPMNEFYHLLAFSFSLVMIHYGGELILFLFRKNLNTHHNESFILFAENYVIAFFNFLRLKLVYVLIMLYQIVFIIFIQKF